MTSEIAAQFRILRRRIAELEAALETAERDNERLREETAPRSQAVLEMSAEIGGLGEDLDRLEAENAHLRQLLQLAGFDVVWRYCLEWWEIQHTMITEVINHDEIDLPA
jgi:hypothetical protein